MSGGKANSTSPRAFAGGAAQVTLWFPHADAGRRVSNSPTTLVRCAIFFSHS
ncbi:hypothetical protein BN2497_13563 [Janthinobacterium sp. CG23_2]|nr:hypothetical protein BN2497_13563 [Janthinobacterium sp. CG23_2]CUU33179.1 hypothetical protein BN3177_13563 [Janthinobacterium sp. CG23_2]